MSNETNTVELLDGVNSFDHYQEQALRTESSNSYPTDTDLLKLVLGINIASSEILDGFKKQIYYGKEEKLVKHTLPALQKISELVQYAATLLVGHVQPDGSVVTTDEKGNPIAGLHLGTEIPESPTLHCLLGIITESGEIGEIMLKALDGQGIDPVNLQEEMADINWYQAVANKHQNLDFYQGLTNNANKLRLRFPNKFTEEDADNRNLEAEREQLSVGINA